MNRDLKAQAEFLLKQAEIMMKQHELEEAKKRVIECEEEYENDTINAIDAFVGVIVLGMFIVLIITEIFKG